MGKKVLGGKPVQLQNSDLVICFAEQRICAGDVITGFDGRFFTETTYDVKLIPTWRGLDPKDKINEDDVAWLADRDGGGKLSKYEFEDGTVYWRIFYRYIPDDGAETELLDSLAAVYAKYLEMAANPADYLTEYDPEDYVKLGD